MDGFVHSFEGNGKPPSRLLSKSMTDPANHKPVDSLGGRGIGAFGLSQPTLTAVKSNCLVSARSAQIANCVPNQVSQWLV